MTLYAEIIDGVVRQTVQDTDAVKTAQGTQYPANYPKSDIPNLRAVTMTAAPSLSLHALNGYSVQMVGGVPTQVWESTPLPLATVQDRRIGVLRMACTNQIIGGFTSAALGASHTYPSNTTDQQNLTAAVATALAAKVATEMWVGGAPISAGDIRMVRSSYLVATAPGITGGGAPVVPAIGSSVIDGSVTWQVWATKFWCEDSSGTWAMRPHTISQIIRAGADGKAAILAAQWKLTDLTGAVQTASTPEAVQAITW